MSVIATFKFDDLVSACKSPGNPNRTHGGFSPRVHHTYHFNGGPIILNGANEVAVAAFLELRIGFLDIVETVETALATIPHSPIASLDDVLSVDAVARRVAGEIIATGRGTA